MHRRSRWRDASVSVVMGGDVNVCSRQLQWQTSCRIRTTKGGLVRSETVPCEHVFVGRKRLQKMDCDTLHAFTRWKKELAIDGVDWRCVETQQRGIVIDLDFG